MKVYISGPISGLTQEEYHTAFARAEAMLLEMEHEPVNPIKIAACADEDCYERLNDGSDLPIPGGGAPLKEDGVTFLHHYGCYMKYDIIALLECEAIALLPGFENSRGAQVELAVAKACGLKDYLIDHNYEGLL